MLSIGTLVEEAERNPLFSARRQAEPILQGDFQLRWELLLAMSKERGADTVRAALCAHMWRYESRFQHLFLLEPARNKWDDLLRAAKELRLLEKMNAQEDDFTLVQKWALHFLSNSTHADENYMRVLLDWLGNKVAIMNFSCVRQESGNMLYYHLPLLDLVDNDRAVLLIKLLNIEHHGASRLLSNHFDVVCGRRPVEFLEDLASSLGKMDSPNVIDLSETTRTTVALASQPNREPVVAKSTVDRNQEEAASAAGQHVREAEETLRLALLAKEPTVTVSTAPEQAPIDSLPSASVSEPKTISATIVAPTLTSVAVRGPSTSAPTYEQAEELFLRFDRSSIFGPKSSLTRRERWSRGIKCKVDTEQFEWVDALIAYFPDLADRNPGLHRTLPVSGVNTVPEGREFCPRVRPQAARAARQGRQACRLPNQSAWPKSHADNASAAGARRAPTQRTLGDFMPLQLSPSSALPSQSPPDSRSFPADSSQARRTSRSRNASISCAQPMLSPDTESNIASQTESELASLDVSGQVTESATNSEPDRDGVGIGNCVTVSARPHQIDSIRSTASV